MLRRKSLSFIFDSQQTSLIDAGLNCLLLSGCWRLIQAVCWDISNVSGLLYELLIIKEKSMHTAEELNGIYYFKGLKKLSAYELLFWVNNLGTFVGRTVPALG